MCDSVQLSRKEQDALLLDIYASAQKHALVWVRAHYREDIVQEVALECLERLRARTWVTPALGLDRYVELRVLDRRIKRRRSRHFAERRDARYLRTFVDAPREWMSQELKGEEDRLRDFAAAVRKTLSKGEVRAHLLVRDDDMTYAKAAKILRIPRERIHTRMTTVHHVFRAALKEIGIEPHASTRGGRQRRPVRSSTRLPRSAYPGRIDDETLERLRASRRPTTSQAHHTTLGMSSAPI
jgi:DNA-directed RNA polymerase specialized sigma24 family protein